MSDFSPWKIKIKTGKLEIYKYWANEAYEAYEA